MATLSEIFTNIANAIRNKTGDTEKLTPIDMVAQINSLISPYAFGTLTSDIITAKAYTHFMGTSAENKYYATLSAGYANVELSILSNSINVINPSLTFNSFTYSDRSGMISTATTDYLIYLAYSNGSDASFILNKNLTLSDINLMYCTAVTANTISFGNYGIISNYNMTQDIIAVDNNLTTSLLPFTSAEDTSCSTNEYAFLIKTYNSNYISCINKSLTRSFMTKSTTTDNTVCSANAEVAMFLGFNDKAGTLVCVKNDLTITNLLSIPVYRYKIGTTSNDYYMLFGGGIDNMGKYSNIVDAYDANLSKVIAPTLSFNSYNLLGTHIGKFMLFESGFSNILNNYYVI